MKLNNQNIREDLSSNDFMSLITDLGNKDETIRQQAKDTLTANKESAIKALVKALSNSNARVRKQVVRILDELHVDWTEHADTQTIDTLINDLHSDDGTVRVRARAALVSIGRRSVSALSTALEDEHVEQRWEAAKALEQIGDQAAVGALVKALEDKIFDVRWLAAEGLINIGRPSIIPLLRRLVEHSDSVWIREGSHHVFHDLFKEKTRKILEPVIQALEDNEAAMKAPLAAEIALNSLVKNNKIS